MRVLVTRAVQDAPLLSEGLRKAGCDVVEVPLLVREAVPSALGSVGPFDWLVLTSAAAAESATALIGTRAAAVGPATADRARALGFEVAVVPTSATGVDLVAAMGNLVGKRVVYPHAEEATAATARALREAGAEVEEIVTYRNVAPPGVAEALRAAWPVDVVTLLSASAARRLAEGLVEAGLSPVPCVVIGPSTAAAAREAGLEVAAIADPHTIEGVIAAVRA